MKREKNLANFTAYAEAKIYPGSGPSSRGKDPTSYLSGIIRVSICDYRDAPARLSISLGLFGNLEKLVLSRHPSQPLNRLGLGGSYSTRFYRYGKS